MHYIEYLCQLIRLKKLDPITILTADDLETVVRRAAKKLPPNAYGTPREMYRSRLFQIIKIATQLHNSVPTTKIPDFCVYRLHYIEYLVGLIGRHKLDPISILDLVEVSQELRRRGKELPERSASCNDQEYRNICIKIVKEQIPLE